jgi:Transposase IS116/IS110/IS902 family
VSVYVGIDVHRKRSQVAVIGEDGRVQLNRNVVNGSQPMLGLLGGLPAGTPVAFEAAFGWGWLAGLLADYGFQAHLVHPLRCKAAVQATGSHLMDICGIGPAGAARILADVGDIARFPGRSHFASWTGTAPIDASSGQHTHHRLSRAGNRRLNHVLYLASIVQLRHDTPGRAYYRRKVAGGKTSMEAMRCLRRRPPAWSTASSPPTPRSTSHPGKRAREGTPGRLCHPARPAFPRAPALRISHFPDPHTRRYRHPTQHHSPWPP